MCGRKVQQLLNGNYAQEAELPAGFFSELEEDDSDLELPLSEELLEPPELPLSDELPRQPTLRTSSEDDSLFSFASRARRLVP